PLPANAIVQSDIFRLTPRYREQARSHIGYGVDDKLLVTDPEHCGTHHQDNQEQNGPGINSTVAFPCFGRIAHCIASCRFCR
ncbi:hypothetical protein ACIPQ1_12915, partial [Pseudomonas sp. LARHCG127]